MINAADTTIHKELLAAHRRTLAILLRQLANLGTNHASPGVHNGIADARAQITQLKAALRAAGVAVDDLAGDVTTADEAIAQVGASARAANILGDYVAGDKFTGDKVAGNKYETHHHYPPPLPPLDLAAAQALLDRMPLDTVPAPTALPTPHRMPLRRNPQFVGRADELTALAAALKTGGVAAITTGIGGVGKTQLASEFAHRYGQYFAGGVFWLSFADPAGVDAEIAACGGAGTMELYTDADGLSQAEQVAKVVTAWEQEIPHLLIFDNCDDAPGITAEQQLAARLPKSTGSRVLVTSRRGQWRTSLGIMSHPLDVLSRAESIALLRGHRADLSDADADAIAAELGDLPLALTLAGSYLDTYRDEVFGKPQTYLSNLRRQLLDHRSLNDHERSVYVTFDLSYQRLNAADPVDTLAITALARAAHLAPGEPFPRNILLSTLGDAADDEEIAVQRADAIRRLVALGLLDVAERGALRIHRLLALFVRKVIRSEDGTDPRIAVERIMIQEAHNRNETKNPADLVPILAHLRALIHTTEQREDLQTAGLWNELGRHLWMYGAYEEAKSYFERTLRVRDQVLGHNHPETARSLNNLALVYQDIGQNAQARDLYKDALQIHEQYSGPAEVAATMGNLAVVLNDLGELEQALLYRRKALDMCMQIYGDNHPQTALSLNNLAVQLHIGGEYDEAQRLYKRAYTIYRAVYLNAANPEIARTLHNLGELLEDQKKYRRARPYFERALAMLKQVLSPSHPDIADTLDHLACCLRYLGDTDEASAMEQQASEIRKSLRGDDASQLPESG